MKTLLRKTNNRVFANLLRSHFRRPAGSASACPEFDADRANAYVERGLADVERARYERHLSGCAACRTSVVALARMAEADSIASPVPNLVRHSGFCEPGWIASLKPGLWAIASPRWAIVATVLVVISISTSLLVWRNGERPIARDKQSTHAEAPRAAEPAAMFDDQAQEPSTPGAAKRSSQQVATVSRQTEREVAPADTYSGALSFKKADETSVVAGKQPGADALERKVESGDVVASRDDARLKEANERGTAGAGAPSAPQPKAEPSKEVAKISKDNALKLPPEDTRSAKVETLKPGTIDSGPKTEREQDAIAAIRSNDGAAPKHKAVLEGESRTRLANGAGGRALVGGESARPDRSHSPRKTVGKKTFWLSRGVWTDSEYNSDRKLPVVTIVRDSDVYKEMLEKNNKLKVFFKGFTETERAIIVFKNTVYNLIPQSDNK